MILPTMTLTELAKEIQSDYKEVHARWTKFNPKFNKMRLKQTYYPWIWNTEIITKKNNKWFFSFYAQSKEDANVVIPHAYITFRYGGTTWAAYPLKGTNVLLIFSSHFFERYIEPVSYTHLDVYKRQTLNAVVIVIPISAQSASNCRFKSASIRMLIFVFAIDSNSFRSYYIHCIIFYSQCQYTFLVVYPSTGP